MPIEMTCIACQQPFYCYPSEAETGRKYCSVTCRGLHLNKKEGAANRTPVGFTCANCGTGFHMMQSYLTAYQKKFGRDPMYCSMKCSGEGRRKTSEEKNTLVCQSCGVTVSRRRNNSGKFYTGQKFCSPECKVKGQMQKAADKFNSGEFGRHVKRNGYVWITVPSLITGKKHEVLEHRYIMSKKLGRPLFKEETVHHINGIRADNSEANLELFSSRHGPGQRVIDKVDFAIEILRLYPEFARQRGVELRELEPPINGAADETHGLLSLPS